MPPGHALPGRFWSCSDGARAVLLPWAGCRAGAVSRAHKRSEPLVAGVLPVSGPMRVEHGPGWLRIQGLAGPQRVLALNLLILLSARPGVAQKKAPHLGCDVGDSISHQAR